jgi:ketosteroid isomerase-like protein
MLLSAVLALFSVTAIASGQNQTPEQEFRRFLIEHDKRVRSRDIEYLERVFSENYAYTGPDARMTNREGALKHFKRQRDNPTSRRISLTHDNVKVHIVGNMALSTHDWTAQTAPFDAPGAEPITDRGRYTGVFEKRNGRWMVLAEHDSEQIYDDKWMVSGVLQAAREYNRVVEQLQSGRSYTEVQPSGGIAALSRLLADEYTYTGSDGAFLNKDQAQEQYKTGRIVIQRAEYLEQEVRTIGNGLAVETGKIRYVGMKADLTFDTTHRYTRTWALYDGRWQITADHISVVR